MSFPGERELLERFFQEQDASRKRALLEVLLVRTAKPVLELTLHHLLRGDRGADTEELVAAGLLSLTERLLASEPGLPLENLSAYASAVAYNLYRGYLRERYPERARLVGRVRYCLRSDRRLALWTAHDGTALAGLSSWSGRPAAPAEPSLLRHLALPQPAREIPLADLICRLALQRGGPWPLPELLEALASLLGLEDAPPLSLSGPGAVHEEASEGGQDVAEPLASAEHRFLHRERLSLLWREISLLPVRQRQALLLNLRDPQGGDLLSLLPLAEIASWAELARCLETTPEELRRLAPRLPLEDREIADWIGGITPRQVINLRKSARARLARRLRAGSVGSFETISR
jgi:hypothetical protein